MVIDNGKKMSDQSKRRKSNHPALVVCGDSLSLFGKSKAGNTLKLIMKVIPCGITFMHHGHLYTINIRTA
jgi:hypothetical protein